MQISSPPCKRPTLSFPELHTVQCAHAKIRSPFDRLNRLNHSLTLDVLATTPPNRAFETGPKAAEAAEMQAERRRANSKRVMVMCGCCKKEWASQFATCMVVVFGYLLART